jgi:transcription elongation factor SPT6
VTGRGELIELEDKIYGLDLEEYAAELESAGKGKRFKQFEAIQQELRFPWYDRRKPLAEPSAKELFTLITGETDQSLYAGMKVGCKVLEARGGGATVLIDNGMRGNVHISRIVDPPHRVDDIKEVLRVSQWVGVHDCDCDCGNM